MTRVTFWWLIGGKVDVPSTPKVVQFGSPNVIHLYRSVRRLPTLAAKLGREYQRTRSCFVGEPSWKSSSRGELHNVTLLPVVKVSKYLLLNFIIHGSGV